MNLLFVAFLNTIVFGSCGNFQSQEKDIDYVPVGEIVVSDLIPIGSSESKLHEAFDKPDSIVKHYNPIIDRRPVYNHYYGRSYFEVIDGQVATFEIVDKGMFLLGLKVGDPIEKIANKFPSSYSNRYGAGKDRSEYEVIKVCLITKYGEKDDSFFILFRISEDKISSIEYWKNT